MSPVIAHCTRLHGDDSQHMPTCNLQTIRISQLAILFLQYHHHIGPPIIRLRL